jgi:D-sedoheptulose 7-phosphate isomerase
MDKNEINLAVKESINVKTLTLEKIQDRILNVINVSVKCIQNGGTIFWAGNGGSAADAQHMAAELVGRFKSERRPIRSLALGSNVSTLTAIANDYDYSEVFRREISAYGKKGDVLFLISTSGNSKNILALSQAAKDLGIFLVGLTGQSGGLLGSRCDVLLNVESKETPRIQECHLLIEHLICEGIENAFTLS